MQLQLATTIIMIEHKADDALTCWQWLYARLWHVIDTFI